MKKPIDTLDATPSKRLYQSIIADYDLNRSICELVDNGLDVWVRGGRSKPIAIDIILNGSQQTITVRDNAGGLRKSEMRYIVAPGETGTKETDETIGIFGVGTKRAVVALAQDIRIATRHAKDHTYQLDFDEAWLEDDDDWQLNVYEVDALPESTTVVELRKLRTPINEEPHRCSRNIWKPLMQSFWSTKMSKSIAFEALLFVLSRTLQTDSPNIVYSMAKAASRSCSGVECV